MPTIWKVQNTNASVLLRMQPTVLQAYYDAIVFDGRTKAYLDSFPPPQLIENTFHDARHVCHLAPGVIVLDSELFFGNQTLYDSVAIGPQIVEVRSNRRQLVLINSMDFAKPSKNHQVPCNVYGFDVPLFRIQNRSPFELYCITKRFKHDTDNFKTACDDVGLTGLAFHEVWSGDIAELEA